MNLPPINILDYSYELTEDRIASYPLPLRDKSKLLVYAQGEIHHHEFSQLPDLLPNNSVLYFNDTKVIPARFLFHKDTGTAIEVFLLAPLQPSTHLSVALSSTGRTTWNCAIGNVSDGRKAIFLQRNQKAHPFLRGLSTGRMAK